MEMKGKVALVTGGAVRIGRAISQALADGGATVAVNYHHSDDDARSLVAEIEARGGTAAAFQADVSRVASIEQLFDQVTARFGGVDVLVNNAAIFPQAPIENVTEAQWDQALDTNLKGPFFCARRAGLEMRKRGAGKIVNLADITAFRPWPTRIPYCVAKAGIVALTQALARALAPEVQVNAVAPGAILFPDNYTEEQKARVLEPIPMKRTGEPEDIARTVRFLIEGPDFITGVVVPVDGGRLLV